MTSGNSPVALIITSIDHDTKLKQLVAGVYLT